MNRYKQYYVSFPDEKQPGPYGPTCGHQHQTRAKAINCGGNCYRVETMRAEKEKCLDSFR